MYICAIVPYYLILCMRAIILFKFMHMHNHFCFILCIHIIIYVVILFYSLD
jgi:hypothetical protein